MKIVDGDGRELPSDGQAAGEQMVQITGRRKDVIKSGGEWICSIAIENIAMAHPQVAMAACIAARHLKWAELLRFFEGRTRRAGRPTTSSSSMRCPSAPRARC